MHIYALNIVILYSLLILAFLEPMQLQMASCRHSNIRASVNLCDLCAGRMSSARSTRRRCRLASRIRPKSERTSKAFKYRQPWNSLNLLTSFLSTSCRRRTMLQSIIFCHISTEYNIVRYAVRLVEGEFISNIKQLYTAFTNCITIKLIAIHFRIYAPYANWHTSPFKATCSQRERTAA